MIDFRYHLVSIVAVFLALAVGLVLGSTELRGVAFTALDKTSSALSAKLSAANSENANLQQQVNGDSAFAGSAEPVLLSHLLDGRRAVIITEPGASAGVTHGITTALGDAGATVSGQVALAAKFSDTSASTMSLLQELTQRLSPGTNSGSGTPQQQAAQVLASALLSTGPHSPGTAAGSPGSGSQSSGQAGSNAQTILSGYSAAGFLTVSGQPTSGATLAVIVTPAGPPAAGSSDPGSQSVVALATEAGKASQATVVAGSSAGSGQGSALAAVRSSSAASQVSTVDNADTLPGQIVAVQALSQEVNGHKPGRYGTQQDAASVAPSPVPTPGTSTAASPAAKQSGSPPAARGTSATIKGTKR